MRRKIFWLLLVFIKLIFICKNPQIVIEELKKVFDETTL